MTGATRTHRVGIAAFAQPHFNSADSFHARRPQDERVRGALPLALAKWDWRADEPGRLDNETRQRGHFL